MIKQKIVLQIYNVYKEREGNKYQKRMNFCFFILFWHSALKNIEAVLPFCC